MPLDSTTKTKYLKRSHGSPRSLSKTYAEILGLARRNCDKSNPPPTAISQILLLLPLALTMSAQEWRFYGGDAGGTRSSPLKQINRQNVKNLKRVWTYHMREVDRGGNETDRHNIAPFESTPIMIEGVLYFSTSGIFGDVASGHLSRFGHYRSGGS